MLRPTDKQLSTIAIIEKKLPFVKFTGTTREEAFTFIGEHMEASKRVGFPSKRTFSSRDYSYSHNDVAPHQESDRERYEKYIEEISWNYVEAAGDDGWGGIASRDMARRLHPFEDWKRSYS